MDTTIDLVTVYIAGKVRRGEWNTRTIEQNRSRLGGFAKAMPTPAMITAGRIERWVHRKDLAPRYRAARLSSARGFCKWATCAGHLKRNPALDVAPPRIPTALPRALTVDEVGLLLTHCDLRTRLCVLLMTQEGMRRGEVASVDLADIDFRHHVIGVRGKNGAGQVTASIPVSDETWECLLDYLDGVHATHGPLLRNEIHKSRVGLSPGRISELVMVAMRDAGIKRFNGDGKSAHALRHTAAHDILEQTGNVYAVQQALRHRSITSTQIYLRGSVRDLRKTMGGRRYGAAIGDTTQCSTPDPDITWFEHR